jgi:hypothetical protein
MTAEWIDVSMDRSESAIYRKANGLVRFALVHGLSGIRPYYIVNEYPKSGGTWVGQMLSSLLEIPFPRNRLPGLVPSVLHGHYLTRAGMRNVVLVWRDGRDVIISWYYHCLFIDRPENARLREIVRDDLRFEDYADIQRNLPAFIDYAFTRQRHPAFSWSRFVDAWYGRPNATAVRYEDLRRDTIGEMSSLIGALTGTRPSPDRVAAVAELYSFARQAGRAPGEADSRRFLRNGVVGDWRNHFSLKAREAFHRHAGDQLIRLGYESDNSWIEGGSDGEAVLGPEGLLEPGVGGEPTE